jgi:hypothetical protein
MPVFVFEKRIKKIK